VEADRGAPYVLDLPKDVLAILLANDIAKNGPEHSDDGPLFVGVIVHVGSSIA
jgi:hypothetical protein